MQSWEEFKEAVNHLAHVTIRKWMVAVDLDDVKQSIWAEFFRILDFEPCEDLSKRSMIEKLRHYCSTLKREEGERKFGARKTRTETHDNEPVSRNQAHWRKVKHMWEDFIAKQQSRDATILRFAAQGATNATIAGALSLSESRIRSRKALLISKFKEEVENSVQTDISQ
jgi:DNA-binding NarL/FixJ family response regulator